MEGDTSSSEEDNMILEYIFSEMRSSSEEENFSGESDEEKRIISKTKNFVEFTVPFFDNILFQQHFRVLRQTFNLLLSLISVSHLPATYPAGRENISCEKGLLMTLWYLANQETYRQISDRFNIAQSTALRIIKKIVRYFVEKRHDYVRWPTQQDAQNITRRFQMKHGFENVVGAIDATHILINRPRSNQLPYCNRKGGHSVILQGVVVDQKRFINVYCGKTGCNHDARVFRRSALYMRFYRNGLPNEMCLLADSAYPNLDWMITPYRDNGILTPNERLFNYRHSATRIIVENAFGLLKGRFRRLRHFDNVNLDFVVKAIVAACVLHNICFNMHDICGDDFIDQDLIAADGLEEN